MTTPPHPFRFLDLPKELRLMVYSHLPSPTTETLHITRPAETHGHLIMHYTRFPTSLLSTCRRLNEEVAPVLTKAYDACVFETTHAFDTVNPKCLENVLCLLILTGIMSNVRFAAESAIEETAREAAEEYARFFAGTVYARQLVEYATYASHVVRRCGRPLRIRLEWRYVERGHVADAEQYLTKRALMHHHKQDDLYEVGFTVGQFETESG